MNVPHIIVYCTILDLITVKIKNRCVCNSSNNTRLRKYTERAPRIFIFGITPRPIYPRKNNTWYTFDRKTGLFKTWSESFGKQTNVLPLPKIKPRFWTFQPHPIH